MLSEHEYKLLQGQSHDMWSKVAQARLENKAELKQRISKTQSEIDKLFKEQSFSHPEIQESINKIIENHTQNVVQASAQFYAYEERLNQKIVRILKQIEHHANKSFIMGFKHQQIIDPAHTDAIHWNVYFRYDKFSESSRVIFLNPSETSWRYTDGKEGSSEVLDEQQLISGYNTIRWLEYYDSYSDTLVMKLLS